MVKVINPTDQDVRIVVKGVEYIVAAEGELAVSDAVGDRWERTHGFLQFEREEGAEVPAEEASDDDGGVNLDGLSRDELDELAEAQGLDSESFRTKADVISALKDSE